MVWMLALRPEAAALRSYAGSEGRSRLEIKPVAPRPFLGRQCKRVHGHGNP